MEGKKDTENQNIEKTITKAKQKIPSDYSEQFRVFRNETPINIEMTSNLSK